MENIKAITYNSEKINDMPQHRILLTPALPITGLCCYCRCREPVTKEKLLSVVLFQRYRSVEIHMPKFQCIRIYNTYTHTVKIETNGNTHARTSIE